ncbi:sorbitol dehydrogenase-like [Tubulanus polymorphus]|uniref:sorbitol dehydrogenase-like n=1 Tax=Tubulanus polymorphus TaxID=672921 RepID=UPI003DA4CAC3
MASTAHAATLPAAGSNIAAVLYGKNDLRIEHRQIPDVTESDVLIRVAYTGICGTDAHLLTYAQLGRDLILDGPMVLGHEASGTVIEVGSKVESLKPGDRVAMDNVISCLKCYMCKKGRQNLCKHRSYAGMPNIDGSLQYIALHPAGSCYKLPNNVSLEEGALIEPLSIGIFACDRGEVSAGSKVLVCGAGTIGLVTAMSAIAMGASRVCVTDVSPERLTAARRIVNSVETVLVGGSDENDESKIYEALCGRPDISIECSGAYSSLLLSIQVTDAGGTVILVGFGEEGKISVPIHDIIRREISIRSIFGRNCKIYPMAIEAVNSGKINLKGLITHRRDLRQIHEAIDIAKTGRDGAIKVMINVEKLQN